MSVEELVNAVRDYGLTIEPNIVICDRRVIDEAADKLEELAAENHEHLRRNAELNREMSGVRRSYSQEKSLRIKAEAALAERDKEIAALEAALDSASDDPELWRYWRDEAKALAMKLATARNAGGKDEPCRGCGDGDKVPASGYWRCPVCDAEWSGEDAE